MIPHERTPLTYAEQQTLLELERSFERVPSEPDHRRTWPWQLAGVVIVAVSALVVGGLASAARTHTSTYTSAVIEGMIGVVGLSVGAALAIDPVRRYVRSMPPVVGIASWRRRRLARRLDRTPRGRGAQFAFRRSRR